MKKIINHRLIIRNQKGIALVMVLILSAVGLTLMTTLIYMITVGTQVSGLQKRYKSAIEAGMGGVDITLQVLSMKDREMTEINTFKGKLTDAGITVEYTTPDACTGGGFTGLQTKLRASATNWNAANCNKSLAIYPDTSSTYDMLFKLGTSPQYTVYAKIVDMVSGSPVGADAGLLGTSVVSGQGESIEVAGIPNLYTVEILSQNSANPQEKAKVQVLYQY